MQCAQKYPSWSLGDLDDMVKLKRFLIELAESVAQAAGAGVFGTGENVTPEEQAFVKRLKEMLVVGSSPNSGACRFLERIITVSATTVGWHALRRSAGKLSATCHLMAQPATLG